jgi:hypothetical protein
MSDNNDNLEKIVNDISNLQNMELNTINELSTGISNGSITSQNQINSSLQSISDVTALRTKLYSTLGNMYSYYGVSLENQTNILKTQKNTMNIVEYELNSAKEHLRQAIDDKNNKLRQVEINNYYIEQYNDHSKIMKYIVLFSCLTIILFFINKTGLLPGFLYSLLLILILSIGSIVVVGYIILTFYRNNMDYNQFNWMLLSNGPPSGISVNTDNPLGETSDSYITCKGQECCPTNYTYSLDYNICLPNKI